MKRLRYTIYLLIFCMLTGVLSTEVYAYDNNTYVYSSFDDIYRTSDEVGSEDNSEDGSDEVNSGDSQEAEQVSASSNAAVIQVNDERDARNGILQVQLVYTDDNNEKHVINSGTGFLIGTDEEAKYVITSYTTAFPSEELREAVGSTYGVKADERKNMSFELQVAVKRDVVVSASVETSSAELGFAALTLSKEIYDRTPLYLDPDLDEIGEMSEVYTLGFPSAIQGEQDVALLTYEDVSVMNGIVSKKTMVDGRWVVQHSAIVTDGNVGGPLVDKNGNVIGVNQIILEDGYNYSVHISEITSILDALGIPYMAVDHTVIPEVDKSGLIAALTRAESMDLSGYTKESVLQYNTLIAEARLVADSEEATQDQVNEAVQKISDASASLVVKSNLKLYLIFGGVVLVFVIIIIVLIAIMLNKKTTEEDLDDDNTSSKKASKKNKDKKSKKSKKEDEEPKPYEKIFENVKNTVAVDNETSVLNSAMGFNDGETTVLSAAPSAITATLIRCKSNESVQINKDQFYIGKDGLKSDFCVKGNPSISRTHALIKRVDNSFFIEDLKATNGTYHNDVKLQPSQSVKLSNGDRIKMADEEFIFRV
ncbi:MAG: FHA domain-containing protein [Lachnospiraceae bacterium]|nr:FHA domain-containing protein [Lachnospiraceae bacterium]